MAWKFHRGQKLCPLTPSQPMGISSLQGRGNQQKLLAEAFEGNAMPPATSSFLSSRIFYMEGILGRQCSHSILNLDLHNT